ncbi:lipopolysaccharide heptosyltransferase I [Helicobacter sp.]|uniref:lipopolysaccharide heptosyltransferase I n=1 Tax=Helicobacter sp. TaxID=218 RepID=UPI00199DB43B|nr:lipopolysaccharide heptosyltransferase I [Helicobacter sp.]MBD5164234.1 lipopolysaccharide heptosyltransferase I [Helicobacter sp.]
MKTPLKIAIVRLSAMGDIIHSASVLPILLESLKTMHNITLHWYVDSVFSAILEDSPCIDRLVTLPFKQAIATKDFKALKAIYHTLKQESYDMVLDLQGLLKSAFVSKILTTAQIIGFQSAKESLATLFYHRKIPIPYEEHILLRNATLAFGALGLSVPTLETLKNPKDFLGFQNLPLPFALPQGKKVLCVLETSKANKTYPLESFVALASLLNTREITPLFLSRYNLTIPNPKSVQFQNIHNLNLNQVKTLVAQMDLIIGGDTGITHLAWALHRPSITLFGATPPQRFNLHTMQNLSLSANAEANYQKDDFSIRTISPASIYEVACRLLDQTPKDAL